MTYTGPQEVDAFEASDASFVIEEGHFGPHLPRPNWEVLFAVGGTALLLFGAYLPWLTIRQQNFNQLSDGSSGPTSTTITHLGGWGFVSQGFLHAQGGSLGGLGLLLLVEAPALTALVTLAMNALWYRGRASTLTCGVAVSALAVGLCVLFGESSVTLFITLLYAFGAGSGPLVSQVGFGLPLTFLGYIGLAAATFTMCARYWRRSSSERVSLGVRVAASK